MIRVVRLADVAEQPWRNGGGTTRELLAWPGADDWTLRVSVARIAQDGPFSAFPGVSRCFTVLSGNGVELSWQDRAVHLQVGTEPVPFEGGDPPVCRLLNGPTEDLNLMVAQHRARGRLLPVEADATLHSSAPFRGVYTTSACTLLADGAWPLPAHSLAWDDASASLPWRLEGAATGQAWWIDMEPTPKWS